MNQEQLIIELYKQLTEDIEKPMKEFQWEKIRSPLYTNIYAQCSEQVPRPTIRRVLNSYRKMEATQ
jgi:hypothetical protein